MVDPDFILPRESTYLCQDFHVLPIAHFHILWKRTFLADNGVEIGYAVQFTTFELCWN